MNRFCATRMLKNAKYIRNAAPSIIPSREPLDGFKSLVSLDILRRFDRMSDAELANSPELLAVRRTLQPRPERAMQPMLFGDPPFKGALHIVKLIFFTEANGGTISIDDSDMATVLEYATLAVIPISAYCSQYGSNHLEVSPDILQFGLAVTSGSPDGAEVAVTPVRASPARRHPDRFRVTSGQIGVTKIERGTPELQSRHQI